MKNKILFSLVGVLSLIGVSSVKADTFTYTYQLQNLPDVSLITSKSEIISTLYDSVYDYYEENYKENYPYYIISGNISSDFIRLDLVYFEYPYYIDYDFNNNIFVYKYNDIIFDGNAGYLDVIENRYSNNAYQSNVSLVRSSGVRASSLISYNIGFCHSKLFYSNYDVKFSSSGGNNLIINNYLNSGNSLTINGGDTIPTYQSALELDIISDPNFSSNNYTEINLNNYSYVALSLKDYTEREEFYTNVEVQGQYCLTPVYDYGLKEKKDVISGFKNQACSPYYDNYTPVRTYILESDIKNHAIYYLKAFDTSRDNKVKVDTSVFNIHYITFEEADNPILNINGRNYTTIPYDNLTDSATISEEEGYVSGVSCGLGDINCTHDVLGGHSITDIFNKPLEFFKNLIESFVSVFELVTSLITVLPLPMQWFLYLSFTLAIALGIIKIIL